MNHDPAALDQTLREQLSAWMDGELPDEQARFLERRLEHDPQLRATWERWLQAGACLREPSAILRMDVSAGVAAAVAQRPVAGRRRAVPALGLAAVLALAIFWSGTAPEPGPLPSAAPSLVGQPGPRPASPVVLAAPAPASPVPPADLPPLADTLVARPWPRSPLATDRSYVSQTASATVSGPTVGAEAPARPDASRGEDSDGRDRQR